MRECLSSLGLPPTDESAVASALMSDRFGLNMSPNRTADSCLGSSALLVLLKSDPFLLPRKELIREGESKKELIREGVSSMVTSLTSDLFFRKYDGNRTFDPFGSRRGEA
jgi:hypothetical protein